MAALHAVGRDDAREADLPDVGDWVSVVPRRGSAGALRLSKLSGTVRYVGRLDSKPGIFVGIELDVAQEGRYVGGLPRMAASAV